MDNLLGLDNNIQQTVGSVAVQKLIIFHIIMPQQPNNAILIVNFHPPVKKLSTIGQITPRSTVMHLTQSSDDYEPCGEVQKHGNINN